MSDEKKVINWSSSMMATRLLVATNSVKEYLEQINKIEVDPTMPDKEKLSELKKIKQAITKVNEEIDNIKKEIRLSGLYRVS